MQLFKDKVVIVTGAARGCGRLAGIAFAKEGAKVVLTDIDETNGIETINFIRSKGGEGIFLKSDVRKEKDVEDMVKKAVDAYGRLDIAFNNAGVENSIPITEDTEENFNWHMDTNIKGIFFCLKHEIRQMLKNGGGAILNHSSVTSSITGNPTSGSYGASKAAIIGITESVALEVASRGISINALATCGFDIPGDVFWRYMEHHHVDPEKMRALFPIKRFGKPEEFVHAVFFLCSDLARFIVGTTLVVDGGYTVA